MNIEILFNILKYLIVGILIYILFTFIPRQKMEQNDILLIATIIILLYIGFDNLQNIFSKNKADCNRYCSIENNENFTAIAPEDRKSQEIQLVQITPESEVKSKVRSEVRSEGRSENIVSSTVQNDGTVVKQKINGQYSISPLNDPNIARNTCNESENDVNYDKEYDFYDLSIIPIRTNNPDKLYEPGYSYIPPKDWYPTPPRPPICVTNKRSTVCPSYTTGLGSDLKEWNESRRVTGPDSINTSYVKDKLNSGR